MEEEQLNVDFMSENISKYMSGSFGCYVRERIEF